MTHPTGRLKRAAVLTGTSLSALALASLSLAPAAFAAEGDVDVVNTETVQVYINDQGEVDSKRVYEQLTLTGDGSVDLANPIEEEGLRNLDGFSGLDAEDGQQQVSTDVNGIEQLRSVSDYSGDLPLDVSVEYRLDGKIIDSDDLLGAEGALEVIYTVRNLTAQEQEVTYADGKGGTVTETAEVPIPMVGSLTTVAPGNFTEVTSQQANMAGDGQGGTRLSFTMTLFPPLGSDEATFGYTANITDGVVPGSSISALPVNPLESPTFKTAGDSYKGGADTGVKLAAGATEIDSNLLKLRDGAAELLNGLIQLRDGAGELNAGLAGEAAPGAAELASGALRLDDGLGQIEDGTDQLVNGTYRLRLGAGELNDGAGQLADGAGRLADGSGQLDDGAQRLADGLDQAGSKAPALIGGLTQVRGGLVQLDQGLVQLSSTLAPQVKNSAGFKELTAGIQLMIDSIGTTSTPGQTLLYGLDQLRTKLQGEAVPGINQMLGGTTCAAYTLDMIRTGSYSSAHPCFNQLPPSAQQAIQSGALAGGEVNPVKSALLQGVANSVNGAGSEAAPTLRYGLTTLLNDLQRQSSTDPGAIQTLTLLECGVSNQSIPGTCDPDQRGLLQGLLAVQAGIPALVDGIATSVSGAVGTSSDTPEDGTFRGGVNGLVDGVDQLSDGGSDLLAGLGLLSDGANDLADGTGALRQGAGDLSDGAGQLADGTSRLQVGTDDLASGADKLNEGVGAAADGSGQLADGAGQLSDGLQDAADGSGQLAEGLQTAADGAPQIVDGAGRLSEEGMSQLIEAGEATAQDYGKLYAVLQAGSERAQTEDMAYGAPEGAAGLTAYSYELAGNDGESSRNAVRGGIALAMLGLGLGGLALRRRLV